MNIRELVEHTLFGSDGSITSTIISSPDNLDDISTKDMLDLSTKQEDLSSAWEKLLVGDNH